MKKKIKIDEVNFPTLYKKNTQGKIEQWSIRVQSNSTNSGHTIFTTFGEYRGKMQTKLKLVNKGKNIGKKNETNSGEQAWLEAEAKHNGMLKKGYVKSLKDAKAGKTDSIIKGGIVPMAAHKWQNHSHKITYPVMVQPKLDGERCVAIWCFKTGKVTLWTRSRKPILACPHIIKQLEVMLKGIQEGDLFLDGELYKHGLSVEELEKLKGSFRKKTHSPLSLTGEFHIYDCKTYPQETFKQRLEFLSGLTDWHSHVKIVDTYKATNVSMVQGFYGKFLQAGYEGAMVRDPEADYEYKRTKALLKYKPRDDAEFKVIDVLPGEDNTVVFRCVTDEGKPFKATKAGDKTENQKYLKNKKKYIGKMLTVQYQGFSGKNNVPLFPTAIRIRNEL